MRPTLKIIVAALLIVGIYSKSTAQATYTITSNASWTARIGSSATWCGTCTFNISAGVTFTIDLNGVNCGTCTFNNGNVIITKGFTCGTCKLNMDSLNLNAGSSTTNFQSGGIFTGSKVVINSPVVCQGCSFSNDSVTLAGQDMQLQSPATTFTNTKFTSTGASSIKSTDVFNATNSTFKFYNTSYFFNNGSSFTEDNSNFYFNDDSYFKSSTTVNLKNNSGLTAGNGTITSKAYITMTNSVNLYDNSSIKVSNSNNYYTNSTNSYSSVTNSKTYSTGSSIYNCGGTNPNTCKTNYVYGCATMNNSGVLACTPLPVVNLNFSAAVPGPSSVLLSWSTGQEINTDHFAVERSANGADWSTIGTVTSKGYTTLTIDYSFTDGSPLNGTNHYRLLAVDRDGHSAYSRTVVTQFATTGTNNNVSIYPSPIAGQSFHVKTPSTGTVVVNIYGMSGQLFFNTSLKGQNLYEVRFPPTVPHNSYLVIQVIGTGKTQAFTVFNQ
ncbi:autotransporter outer membrane beta-barrel domain-containing protein [Flavitalea flava]